MKERRVLPRVIGIGLFHAFLYLWFVPFVIYPRYGDSGFTMVVIVAVLVSVGVIGTLFLGRRSGNDAKKKK